MKTTTGHCTSSTGKRAGNNYCFQQKTDFVHYECGPVRQCKRDLAKAGIGFRVATKGQNYKHTMPRTYSINGKTVTNTGLVYDLYVHEKDYSKAIKVINGGKV